MRYLTFLICLVFITLFAACRASPDVSHSSPPAPADTATPRNEQTLPASTPAPTRTVGSVPRPTSATPSPPPLLTPLPSSPSFTPEPITPQNALALQPINHRIFSPWEHVLKVTWSPDGEALAVSAGDAVYILDASSLEEVYLLQPSAAATGLSFSPDGELLAVGDRNGVLYVWETASGQLLGEMQAHQKSISALEYSPDGSTLATGGYDAVARLWDARSDEELSEMVGGTFAIPAIAYTPDGSSLAIVNGAVIRLRDVETSRFVRTIVGEGSFYSIAFSPDGKFLASGDVGNTIRIWDLNVTPGPGGETRESIHTLTGHSGRENRPEALIWSVSYSPDGGILASAGGDGTLRLWDGETGQPLAVLSGHSKAVSSAAFSPDGRWLVTGGLDGKLILWGVRE